MFLEDADHLLAASKQESQVVLVHGTQTKGGLQAHEMPKDLIVTRI
jgi:hypothetical protein